jgi:hypothetical protein
MRLCTHCLFDLLCAATISSLRHCGLSDSACYFHRSLRIGSTISRLAFYVTFSRQVSAAFLLILVLRTTLPAKASSYPPLLKCTTVPDIRLRDFVSFGADAMTVA